MALCPPFLAVVCHTGLRSIPLSIPAPAPPALAFDQYCVDLHTLQPTSYIEAKYTFQNRGNTPVQISKIEPSCNCLTPKLFGARDNVIDTDGRGQIIVRMSLGNATPGPHEYTINVKYHDGEPRETHLILKMIIPATLWVTPPSLVVYHPANNPDVTEKDFLISDGRGKRFEVTDVSANTDLINAVIGETNRTETGQFQQTIRVEVAAKLPPGRKTYMMRITTNDTDIPELYVPIMLEGGSAPENEPALDHE